MSLYLNFRVLFPSANIGRHVVKHDLLFEEFVHLALDWIFVTCFNERCCVVDAGHSIEVFVLTGEDAADSKVVVEKVFAMASVRNAIVDKQLKNYLDGSFAVER